MYTKFSSRLWAVSLVILLWPISLVAQITFERTYGGADDDRGFCIQQTSDGGYIAVGLTSSFGAGSEDIYLIKTDSLGDTIWTKTYGDSSLDRGSFVEQTKDGGYIVVGFTWLIDNETFNIYLIKTDALGDTLWTRTYGVTGYDHGSCVRETKDGGYIIVGVAGLEDVYLIKTDSLGDTLWTKTYGGPHPDWGYCVRQTTDGGYIIVGRSYSPDEELNVYLIKTNPLGDTMWTKTYGGLDMDVGYSVEQIQDGGFIIAGYTKSFGAGLEDFYLIKTDSLGDTIWTRTYGGENLDRGYSVHQTADGGYIIAGGTWSFGPGHIDVYLIKTDSIGDTMWTKTFGGANEDWGCSVQLTSDGGYIITGRTASFGAGNYDVYLIKTDSEGNVGIEEQTDPRPKTTDIRLVCYPNPFTSAVSVKCSGISEKQEASLEIYDISGRLIKSIPLTTRTFQLGVDLSAGVYFLKVNGKYVGKVVKVK